MVLSSRVAAAASCWEAGRVRQISLISVIQSNNGGKQFWFFQAGGRRSRNNVTIVRLGLSRQYVCSFIIIVIWRRYVSQYFVLARSQARSDWASVHNKGCHTTRIDRGSGLLVSSRECITCLQVLHNDPTELIEITVLYSMLYSPPGPAACATLLLVTTEVWLRPVTHPSQPPRRGKPSEKKDNTARSELCNSFPFGFIKMWLPCTLQLPWWKRGVGALSQTINHNNWNINTLYTGREMRQRPDTCLTSTRQ